MLSSTRTTLFYFWDQLLIFDHLLVSLTDIFICEQDFFHEGEYIIREGCTGDSFFIINKGEVSER